MIAALALVAGCRETRSLRWEIAFAIPVDRARAAAVVSEVRRGTCVEAGETVWRDERAVGDAAPPVPSLGGGVHAFAAVARDAACVPIARGCTDVVLPTDPGAIVRTSLGSVTAVDPACADCASGICPGDADAGAAGSVVSP